MHTDPGTDLEQPFAAARIEYALRRPDDWNGRGARRIQRIQYGIGAGSCRLQIRAALSAATVMSPKTNAHAHAPRTNAATVMSALPSIAQNAHI